MTAPAFITAADMAAHLRQLVDDDEFITRTVRVHFPAYKREALMAYREIARISRVTKKEQQTRSVKNEPDTYVAPSAFDRADELDMHLGSESLLKALWKAHAPILRHYRAKGLQVVDPCV